MGKSSTKQKKTPTKKLVTKKQVLALKPPPLSRQYATSESDDENEIMVILSKITVSERSVCGTQSLTVIGR